jgi:hypothetical protein
MTGDVDPKPRDDGSRHGDQDHAKIEGRSEWSAKRQEFRRSALKRIAGTLRLLAPALPLATATDMAVILIHNMKTMAALTFKEEVANSPGAIGELREMNRLYVAKRLGAFGR